MIFNLKTIYCYLLFQVIIHPFIYWWSLLKRCSVCLVIDNKKVFTLSDLIYYIKNKYLNRKKTEVLEYSSFEIDRSFMCNLCFKDGIELGIICPGYSLIYWNDKYHILGGSGHSGCIIHTFKQDPIPDPDPDCEKEDDETMRLVDIFLDIRKELEKKQYEDGYLMITQSNININERNFCDWLAHHYGSLVENFKKGIDNEL